MLGRKQQKRLARQNCKFCGPGFPASWEVISDKGEEYVCDVHNFVLDKIHTIQRERVLSDTECKINSSYEEQLSEREFDDIDYFGRIEACLDFKLW